MNSGRATRERSIEQTAVKTNLEAADEAARQMRLRDLAGLIVIDFIDMEDAKNDRAVEKRMKDALRFDRARVQMGKISSFGLMELSRQRRRMSVLEGSSHVCEHCGGVGHVRSIESSALHLLRALDDHAAKHRGQIIEARAPAEVALYVLNEKRETISRLEDGRGVQVRVIAVENLLPPDFELTSTGEHHVAERAPASEAPAPAVEDDDADDEIEVEADEEDAGEAPASGDAGEGGEPRRRRRRGRRGGRRQREGGDGVSEERAPQSAAAENADEDSEGGEESEGEGEGVAEGDAAAASGERTPRRRRRRRGRGGRRSEGGQPDAALADAPQPYESDDAPERTPTAAASAPAPESVEEPEEEPEYEPPAPVMPAPAYAREPDLAPISMNETAAAVLYEDAPAPQAPRPQTDVDYAPDEERREKFFARLSRWGKKEPE